MVTIMKSLISARKGRVRTAVGHKYLEALQSKVNGESDTSDSPSPSMEQKQPGLNLLILGVTSGTAMDDIDFALCRFTQESPEAPLYLDIVQVFPPSSIQTNVFLPNAAVRFRCHALQNTN
jgi:hypothetical protein